jgi:hypothetical protein
MVFLIQIEQESVWKRLSKHLKASRMLSKRQIYISISIFFGIEKSHFVYRLRNVLKMFIHSIFIDLYIYLST